MHRGGLSKTMLIGISIQYAADQGNGLNAIQSIPSIFQGHASKADIGVERSESKPRRFRLCFGYAPSSNDANLKRFGFNPSH